MYSYKLFQKKYLELRRDYGVTITTKDKKWPLFWTIINYVFLLISFGKNKTFNENTVTTVGPYIFYPKNWSWDTLQLGDYVTLCHEADHVLLCKKLGLNNIWLGYIIMLFLYLFIPLPIGLSWFRYAVERRAYLVSYNTWKSLNKKVSYERYIHYLSGSQYLWAWPFKKNIRKWFEKHTK